MSWEREYEGVNNLEIGDLVKVTDDLDYAYADVYAGNVGLVYDHNSAKTRYSILVCATGTRAEISAWDLDRNRVRILACQKKRQEKKLGKKNVKNSNS
jgi:hypothetical protein